MFTLVFLTNYGIFIYDSVFSMAFLTNIADETFTRLDDIAASYLINDLSLQCSVTCGWGEQVREVVCRHKGETFCDVDTKPVTRRNCTTIFPCTDPDG